MKRKQFSEEQIIEILRLHQAGAKPADLCQQHWISEATLYNWRSRYGGMQISDAKRLRSLEEENRRLITLDDEGSQGPCVGRSLRGDDPYFGQVTAQGIE